MAGSGTGGFLPGGGCGAEVGVDVEGADSNAVPLVFLDDDGCVWGLVVEDIEEVCMGHEELLEAFILGSGMGAGCFPLDTGGVGT